VQIRADHVVAVDNLRALVRVCMSRTDNAKTVLEDTVARLDAFHALDQQKLTARISELVWSRVCHLWLFMRASATMLLPPLQLKLPLLLQLPLPLMLLLLLPMLLLSLRLVVRTDNADFAAVKRPAVRAAHVLQSLLCACACGCVTA
jgi:hypothetical protein